MKKLIPIIAAMLMVSSAVCAEEISVHDPSIIKDNGTYYIFGTHITAAKSENLVDWNVFTNGYTATGNTLFGNLSENLAGSFAWAGENDSDCLNGYAVWAPDVFYNSEYINSDGSKGAYLMYYSASSTYKRSCIGLAVSKNIEGPYTYADTLVYSGFTKIDAYDTNSKINKNYSNTNLDKLIAEGKVSGYNDSWGTNDYNSSFAPNCIDPCVYETPNGDLWMVYGSWSGGIFTLPLDKETGLAIYPGKDGQTAGGNYIDRYFGTRIAGGNGLSGEGPFVFYDEEAGYYYLQDTYEWLGEDGGYHIRMFRSKNPDGPFLDTMGRNAVYGSNSLGYQGLKLFGNYRFDEMDYAYKSGGHCSTLIDDDGRRFLFYHTRFSHLGGAFQVRVHEMFLNEDGWYVVSPYRYSGGRSEAEVNDSELEGYYQFINHCSAVGRGATYETAASIYLDSDGTVRGRGTWERNGKYITLSLDGSTYKGVIVREKNEKDEDVIAVTAAGDNNCCVWAVKEKPETAVSDMDFGLHGSLGEAKTVAYAVSGSNPYEVKKNVTFEEGINGKALRMDGSFGLQLPEMSGTESYAVSLWIKPEKFSDFSPIVAASSDFMSGKWLNLTTVGNNHESWIWSRREDLNIWPFVPQSDVYTLNRWQHVIISVDGNIKGEGANTVRGSLYINGTKVSQGDVAEGILTNGGSIYIGANAWDAYFTGLVSDVRVYGGAVDNAMAAGIYENAVNKGMSVSKEGNKIFVDFGGGISQNKLLIGACFKDGKLNEVKAVTVKEEHYEFEFGDFDKIKVFLWDSFEEISPEGESWEFGV